MDGSFPVSARLAAHLGTQFPWPQLPGPVHPGTRIAAISQGLLTTQPARARSQMTFTSALRYGSGAGTDPGPAPGRSRRDHSRDRNRPASGRPTRFHPSGPEETNDWLEALRNVQNGLETLDRNQRNQAAGMAVANENAKAVSAKLEEVAKVVEKHDETLKNIHQNVLPTIDATYAPLAIVEQLRLHSDTLEGQMRSMMDIIQQLRESQAAAIPIHTPVDDPLQSSLHDPWRNRDPGAHYDSGIGQMPAPCPQPSSVPQPMFEAPGSRAHEIPGNEQPPLCITGTTSWMGRTVRSIAR
jgi:hypothetical protein